MNSDQRENGAEARRARDQDAAGTVTDAARTAAGGVHPSDEPDSATATTTAADSSEQAPDAANENGTEPPRTTTWGWLTAPKFGSAGSGGAELETVPDPAPQQG